MRLINFGGGDNESLVHKPTHTVRASPVHSPVQSDYEKKADSGK